jgi:NADP-dependent 3-hydroxy acid dehydrogenase YdfG
MNVVITGRREEQLAAAAAELDGGDRVLTLELEVTDRAAFAAAADAAEARFGNLHVLCNNAGVAVIGPAELATFADWDWVLGVNIGGTINGIVTVLPRMLLHGEGGHIVNTSSMSGLLPHAGATIYSTSKAAVVAMIETMRPELEPKGIICSVFCPGAVQSNISTCSTRRPAELAETGYSAADKPRQANASFAQLFMTKEEAGERVLRGILDDDLYILSHSEFRAGLHDRTEAMRAAVPDRPENADYKSTFPRVFANPAHAAEIARHRKS